MSKIILASSSPRRMEILKSLGIDFEIMPSNFEEKIIDLHPENLVCEFSKNKAIDVSQRVDNNKIIIAADTLVYKDDKVLGKPKTKDEACKMLEYLSGNSHFVVTGVCIIDTFNSKIYQDFQKTKVYFKKLSKNEILSYVNTGEPMDKAGAYGIQGLGSIFVEKIEGCYFNVVGLPINMLYNMLINMGVNILNKDV